MSDPTIDVAVVGGRAIGLAAATRSRTTYVIERLPRPGLETSTHNSGVVHAGIYYPRDSLTAALCVEGRERLYAFCDEHGVPCERCGKLIVAAADQIGAIEALVKRGHANGVTDLEMVDGAFVRRHQARKGDYESEREPLAAFHAAARRLLPGLELHLERHPRPRQADRADRQRRRSRPAATPRRPRLARRLPRQPLARTLAGLLAGQADEELKRAFSAWTKQALMSPQFRATETEPLAQLKR